MKTAEVNQSLVGRRVKGIFTGLQVTGTIVGIVEDLSMPWKPQSDENKVCAKGVRIKLDKPVNWGDYDYDEYESTARICDDWGNLSHTELID